jgi:hypothetical protein
VREDGNTRRDMRGAVSGIGVLTGGVTKEFLRWCVMGV